MAVQSATFQLLRQTGGFEGFGAVEEDPHTRESAVFDFVEVRDRLALQVAPFGFQVQGEPSQNAVAPSGWRI